METPIYSNQTLCTCGLASCAKQKTETKIGLPMSLIRELAKGAIVRNVYVALQIMVSFFMMPIVVHSLGDRMYGFWVLVGTFVGYYGLLDLGLGSAASRYVSRALGQQNGAEINIVISTSLVLFSLVSFAILLISALTAIFCPYFLQSPNEIPVFRTIIIILGLNIAIGLTMGIFGSVITSHFRYDLSSYLSIFMLLTSNALIYYFLKHGHGIVTLAYITLLTGMITHTLTFILAKKLTPGLKINPTFFRRNKVRDLYSYGVKSLITQIADMLRFRIDSLVIAGYLSVSLVTYYSIGARLVDYFGIVVTSSVGMLMPVFSRYEGKGDFDSIRNIFLHATKIATILSVFIGSSIIFYGRPFILRWMGNEFESSYYITLILVIPAIIALLQHPGIGLLYGISKHQYYAVANICEGLLNLVLSLILVRYYGVYGVALGTAIEMLIFKLFIQPVFTCRAIKLSLFKYYFETIFLTVLKTLIPIGLYFYIIKDFVKPDYLNIALSGTLQVFLFTAITYYFILGKTERQFIRRAIG